MQGHMTAREKQFMKEFEAFHEQFYYPELNDEFWEKVCSTADDMLEKYMSDPFYDFASQLVFKEMERLFRVAQKSNPAWFGEHRKEGFILYE